MPGMQWGFLLFSVVAWAQFPTQEPQFRVERRLVPGGAELATVFGRVPDSRSGGVASIPMLAVLRDTLGDQNPDNDRLRYLWVLTSSRPTLLQSTAAAIPFFTGVPESARAPIEHLRPSST